MAQHLVENKGKKYALVSSELYKNLKNENLRTEHTQSPQFSHVIKLDDSIGEILSNSHLPDGIKARMYSEAVADFLAARSKAPEVVYSQTSLPPIDPAYTQHSTMATQKEIQNNNAEINERGQRTIVSTGGPKYNKAAKKSEILEAIKKHENIISYEPQSGELILNGHKHGDTNIHDIVDYISSYKLPADDPPPGTGRFMEALGLAGLPKSIVRHNKLRNLMGQGRTRKNHNVTSRAEFKSEPVILRWTKLY